MSPTQSGGYQTHRQHDYERNEQKKLLIDSPAYIFDQFYYLYLSTVGIIMDEEQATSKRTLIVVDERQFIDDCLNVMIGVSSNSFVWTKVSNNNNNNKNRTEKQAYFTSIVNFDLGILMSI